MSITLSSAGESFTFDLSYFGEGSLFTSLSGLSEEETIPFIGEHEELLALDELLNQKRITPGVRELILKYDILPVTYELSTILEDDMREKMFTTDDASYDALYYGLVRLEEKTFSGTA